MKLKVKKLHPDAVVPQFAHDDDAGMDLFALERTEALPHSVTRIRTGIAMEVPEGYAGLCWDKSGLSTNHGLKTLAGVLDAGYRGELVLAVYNLKDEPYVYEKGHKVMQILIQKIEHPEIVEVDELTETVRGAGGFGSTGK
ncbi:MAG TPA: dUTP diphosphatase [Candidatus Paceibacterota bacterium]|jgi:dUTP pyrophosphatase|nr:dUTP diphosphatase [Candidatus Paceibacterota bacterium]